MTSKTAREVAQSVLDAHAIKPDWKRTGEQIVSLIAEAVAADRAERAASESGFNNALAEQVHDCLRDRETDESLAAAEWVAENEDDDLWSQYVAPMLDSIERNHGHPQED